MIGYLVIGALILVALFRIERRLSKINMNLAQAIQIMTEANVKLDDVSGNLTEGFDEIIELIRQLQETTLTPEQEAIVTALDSKATALQPQAQAIADIVPGPEAATK